MQLPSPINEAVSMFLISQLCSLLPHESKHTPDRLPWKHLTHSSSSSSLSSLETFLFGDYNTSNHDGTKYKMNQCLLVYY